MKPSSRYPLIPRLISSFPSLEPLSFPSSSLFTVSDPTLQLSGHFWYPTTNDKSIVEVGFGERRGRSCFLKTSNSINALFHPLNSRFFQVVSRLFPGFVYHIFLLLKKIFLWLHNTVDCNRPWEWVKQMKIKLRIFNYLHLSNILLECRLLKGDFNFRKYAWRNTLVCRRDIVELLPSI